MDLGPHASFIWSSYAVVTVVLAAVIAWLIVDGRAQQRRLDQLAARASSAARPRAASRT
ncbi:MAG: heme exporter protein CcmD [Hyphomicrobium sp.]